MITPPPIKIIRKITLQSDDYYPLLINHEMIAHSSLIIHEITVRLTLIIHEMTDHPTPI